MSTLLPTEVIWQRLGPADWNEPKPFGPDGWSFTSVDRRASVIVSAAPHNHDGYVVEYIHASISRSDRMPDYDDLCLLRAACFDEEAYAYQVFPPPSEHVNIHERALHLWGRADGKPMLPRFGEGGTI